MTSVRLNLGCGDKPVAGWLNCDVAGLPGVDLRADVARGLPLESDSVDCIAAIHVVQDLAWPAVAPALGEIHRVLRPGGVLRLAVTAFGQSRVPGLAELDNRERETLFVEAAKPRG